MSKFKIKEILSVEMYDVATGEEIVDIRDKKPIEQTFDFNKPVLELVKSISPSYSMCNHPLIRKYGYDTFGMVVEQWFWLDNLNTASELELWQIFGLIVGDKYNQYKYWYEKEQYEFRKYKRENNKT